MTKTLEEAAAIFTIKRPADMTLRGRKQIAKWLRRQADFLEEAGDEMSDRFRARYMYRPSLYKKPKKK